MKFKIIIGIVFFLLFLKFSFAIQGCCLNPQQDVCSVTDSSDCCPEDTISYNENGPVDFGDCIHNYFVESNSDAVCLTLSGDKKDYCIMGCCCENNSFDFKIKGECMNDEKAVWINSTNCSNSVCENTLTPENINKVKEISKENSIINTKPLNEVKSSNGNANEEIIKCDKKASPGNQKDLDCINHGGRVSGGLFHGGLINWFTGNWCPGNDKVVDYGTGFLKRCCKANIENKFNWAEDPLKWLTPVKFQGSCGTCAIFAAVGVAEARYKIIKNLPYKNIDFSEQHVFSCIDDVTCTSGIWTSDVYKHIIRNGLVDEDCCPYKAKKTSCDDVCQNKKVYSFSKRFVLWPSYQIINYGNGFRIDYPTIDCIKKTLKEKGPISIRFTPSGGYLDKNNVIRCKKIEGGAHAVVLVGWDDSKQAWIFKNDWGVGWNGNGYGKLAYNNCDFSVTGGILDVSLSNPSAVYCNKLGYNFTINETRLGQQGICVLPGNYSVDAWQFIEGKIGQEYSLCKVNGWNIKTKTDGLNSFSKDYAVCIINGSEVPVTDLIGLTNSTMFFKKNGAFIKKPSNLNLWLKVFIVLLIIIVISLVHKKVRKN